MEFELHAPRKKSMATTGAANPSKPPNSTFIDSEEIDQLVTSGELAVSEAEQKAEGLTDAKDKAQLTATSAMSIVHITLLKEVLDRGPDMPYYVVSLSLISIALVLQIIVGVIALLIANVKKYYGQYRDDPLDDVFQNLFHCKCKDREKLERERKIRRIVNQRELVDLSRWDMMPETRGKKQGEGMDLEDFTERGGRCCNMPCVCTREVHPHYEYDILDRYDVYCELMVRGEVAVVRPQEELHALQRHIEHATEDIADYEAKLGDSSDDAEDITAQLQAIKGRLDEYQQKAKDLAKQIQDEKVIRRQGKILFKYADAIRKNRVLKMISFWQHSINYTLYVVFIINAFIAGFGMAVPGTADAAANLQADGSASNVASQM